MVRREARREALVERRERLLAEADTLLADLDAIDVEAHRLGEGLGDGETRAVVRALQERLAARRRGDLVIPFRGREYGIDPRLLRSMPLGGILFSVIFDVSQALARRRRSHRR